MIDTAERPLIFDLKPFCLDDGPGIRTTVFLKGCPFSCVWCHNPESMFEGPEIAFYPQKCVACKACAAACPEDCIQFDRPQRIDRTRCSLCFRCVDVCPSTALRKVGRSYPVDELVTILKRDLVFYQTSGGGVTFSGGEPTLYLDYVGSVAGELKKDKVHIAIQTAGHFQMSEFRAKLLPFIDLILFDIKLMDRRMHRKFTGCDNQTSLQNFLELVADPQVEVVPRIPLVPGITATFQNLSDTARFLREADCDSYQLLPFNPSGIAKRAYLGQQTPSTTPETVPESCSEEVCRNVFSDFFSRV